MGTHSHTHPLDPYDVWFPKTKYWLRFWLIERFISAMSNKLVLWKTTVRLSLVILTVFELSKIRHGLEQGTAKIKSRTPKGWGGVSFKFSNGVRGEAMPSWHQFLNSLSNKAILNFIQLVTTSLCNQKLQSNTFTWKWANDSIRHSSNIIWSGESTTWHHSKYFSLKYFTLWFSIWGRHS